jgi:hypothetical protein
MARRPAPLQTSQRQVGISARTADTPAFVPANSSVGFSRAASSLLQMSEGFAREAATEAQVAGQKAAASQKLSVDKAGTPRPLDLPEGGGQFYNDAFNKVADKRYGDALVNSTSEQLAELALDPELIANPDAYSEAAAKITSTMATSMPDDYSLAGSVLDGIAAARVQNEAKIRVNAFNLEMKQGEDQYKAEVSTATQAIYDAAASGRSLSPEQIDAFNAIKEDARVFGVSFNVQKTIDIGEKVYAPVRNIRRSLGPVGLQSTAARLQSGDTTGTGIDPATWSGLPQSQRNQITAGLRAEAVAKNARAAAAAGTVTGAGSSPAAILGDNKAINALRKTQFNNPEYIRSSGLIAKGVIARLVQEAGTIETNLDPQLRAISQVYLNANSTAATGDLSASELGQLNYLGTNGFTRANLNKMNNAEFKAERNPNDQFAGWSSSNNKEIEKAIEGFDSNEQEIINSNLDNFKRATWYEMVGGADSSRDLDQALKDQKDRFVAEYSQPFVSQTAQRFIDNAGGQQAIGRNIMARYDEFALNSGFNIEELKESGLVRVAYDDAGNTAEIRIFLEYRPNVGPESGAYKPITRGITIPEYNKIIPPQADQFEEAATNEFLDELFTDVANKVSAKTIGEKIVAQARPGNTLDAENVGSLFVKYNEEPFESWATREDSIENLTQEEKVAYQLSKSTRLDNELLVSSANLSTVQPEDRNIVNISPSQNRFAGYDGTAYTISNPNTKDGSWMSVKPKQADRMLRTANRKNRTNPTPFLKRQIQELGLVVQHYNSGGDLILNDDLLKTTVEGLARTSSANDPMAVNVLRPEYVPLFQNLVSLKSISPGRLSIGEQETVRLYNLYLRKELAVRGPAKSASDYLERLGNPEIPQAAIDFVARIKANTDG